MRDRVKKIGRLSYFYEKMISAIFFNVIRDYKAVILKQGQQMNSTFFVDWVTQPLAGF
jgi:hypothetical protein